MILIIRKIIRKLALLDNNLQSWFNCTAEISPKNKKVLKRYFSPLYPRQYIKELIASLTHSKENVQLDQQQKTE